MDPANADLLRYLKASEIAERRTPRVVIDAFSTEPAEVGGRLLRPVTLGVVIALESVRHPLVCGGVMSVDQIMLGLYALSAESREVAEVLRDELRRIVATLKTASTVPAGSAPDIAEALCAHCDRAFSTMVKMRSPRGTTGDGINPGFGWWLELLTSSVCALHMRVDEAVHDVPVAQLFALNSCRAWNEGLKPSGKTYLDDETDRVLSEMGEH